MTQVKKNPPRLIEVLMPMEQASILSPKEKNVRSGGYISTFHVWPARRPLAACRAALLATLLPDPGDAKKRAALLDAIGGQVALTKEESEDEAGNLILEEKASIQGGVLAWNAENSEFMDSLRAQIRKANGGKAPRAFDPFSGGGAIPLEAMWLGCDVAASDLNPVAWVLLKGTLEYPQKYVGKKWPLPDFVREWSDFMEYFRTGGKKRSAPKAHFTDPVQAALPHMLEGDLQWHIRAWGRWVMGKAKQDLSKYYPIENAEPTVAYFWARTARDIQTEGQIPILKTFVLSRKKGSRVALLPVPNAEKNTVEFKLLTESDLSSPERRARVIEDFPHLTKWGVTAGTLEDFLKKGTKNDAGIWSPYDKGRPDMLALTSEEVREQGRQGLMGIQMTAVCVERVPPGKKKAIKAFRLPTENEYQIAKVEIEEIESVYSEIPFGIPDDAVPVGGGRRASRAFSLYKYGIKKWRDVLTPRQLLAAGVFLKHTRSAIAAIRESDPENAEALAVYLTVIYGRFIDYCSQQCRWEPKDGEVKSTMSGYKLPLVSDFAEANPLSDRDRYYSGGIRAVSDAVGAFMRACAFAPNGPSVNCVSSLASELTEQDLCFTDPPYYDAIPYADLMNFFRIWQKRILGDLNPEFKEVFERPSPTWDDEKGDGELIDDDSRHGGDTEKSRKTYEDGMTKAFSKSLGALKADGRMVVVFANKEVDAWQSLIAALIRSGALVTASWPIQTEMVNKVTQGRANLSTSVWIVCRKRDLDAQPGWEEAVLADMRTILLNPREELGDKSILRYFFDLNVRGADFLWAGLGPALAAYSAHPYVRKTGGGYLDVKDFLDEVRKLVLHFSLGSLKGFGDLLNDPDQAAVVLDPVTQYYLLHREAFGVEPVLAGVCILYANACGRTDRELQITWNILEQGGKKKGAKRRGSKAATKRSLGQEEPVAPDADEEDDTGDVLNSNAKADKYRLLRWDERLGDEHLGENRGVHAAPLIDKLHRLMDLLRRNRGSEVQSAYDSWGLAADPAFPRLLQAVRELALKDHDAEEQRLVESLASQLRMSRRMVAADNVVRETPLFQYSVNEE